MATQKQASTGLQKLLEDQVADIYYAEKQILKALPKMAKAATNDELREAFNGHLQETQGQIERLEQVFEALGLPAKGKKCPAIDGILEEGKEIMDEFADDAALDAGLVDTAQKVEHYEIATYGNLVAWATQLGHEDVASMLTETLEEEKGADEKLTEICETVVNIEADGEEEEEGEMADVEEGNGRSSNTSSSKTTSKSGAKASSNGSAKRTASNKR